MIACIQTVFSKGGFIHMIKRAFKQLSRISAPAYSVLRGGIMVGTTTMLCSAALFIAYRLTYISYYLRCSEDLSSITFAVMFEAVFGSAFIEEYIRKHT
jgi:uncharacterized MAPEG superfamily protein